MPTCEYSEKLYDAKWVSPTCDKDDFVLTLIDASRLNHALCDPAVYRQEGPPDPPCKVCQLGGPGRRSKRNRAAHPQGRHPPRGRTAVHGGTAPAPLGRGQGLPSFTPGRPPEGERRPQEGRQGAPAPPWVTGPLNRWRRATNGPLSPAATPRWM